jgi:hypothetical protein
VAEPLTKPDHLKTGDGSWLAQRKAAAIAAALGIAAFIVVMIASGSIGTTPDWRVSVPGFVATAIAAVASIARREPGGYHLWLLGLGLAAASLVLGWFLFVAIIVGATALLIVILHAFF